MKLNKEQSEYEHTDEWIANLNKAFNDTYTDVKKSKRVLDNELLKSVKITMENLELKHQEIMSILYDTYGADSNYAYADNWYKKERYFIVNGITVAEMNYD